jgi:hypothetical protein
MNNAKIAAALHALADAFLEGDDQPATKPAAGKRKAAEPTAPAASAPVAQATAAAEPAAQAPVVPTITKKQLNEAVLKVAAKSRDAAEQILARFEAKNTVTLPPEKWQAVFDAFEEEIAKQDAAAVQVAQASLV